MVEAQTLRASMTKDMSGTISHLVELINEIVTYEQVVTTAFSFNSVRHLRELHLKEKSMLLRVARVRSEQERTWKSPLVSRIALNR